MSESSGDSYIVRVKAVVMTRDDSSGGWLAQEGGGLSRVGVCKVTTAELSGHSDFLIHGERLKDKQVILECFVRKDLIYTKATPTFHHWKVDNKKCGLTFQSPADARAFDRGVRKALEDITEGSTTSSSTLQNETELGDDDVFTTATDSSSNSSQKKELAMQTLATSTLYEPHRHHCILEHLHEQYRTSERYFLDQVPKFPRHVSFLDEEEEIVRINPRERTWLTGYEDYRHAAARDRFRQADDADSYVHLAKSEPPKHEYSYPYTAGSEPGHKSGRGAADGSSAVVATQPPSLKAKGKRRRDEGERSRCVYCRDVFNHEENRRGRCHDAPDPVRTCIHRVSFMWCADSLLYHCMSDPEGDYSDPCSCDTGDDRFCLRWLALLGLSLLAPCLCCYPPLHACHRCGVACGCCGGKHKAVG
ncbi:sprouty-related, EVH1 domain-containing protein 2 isoform X2 [Electrophorus electricus]|uniref:sprouty-related, EVH1 domain-containing protein 2 isoform X2 n=1 Tax=Electrophorus electricus TaxID=8005 RepID=UPI0015D03ADA|nr:sprouty-related, EVH1 domain-containing protein 2 isoform X2 [Electrophorus electricus]